MQPNKINGRTTEERNWMCQRKHRWSDELAARAAALQSLERRPKVFKLYTYKCPVCLGYHLTRKKQPGQVPVMLTAEESKS